MLEGLANAELRGRALSVLPEGAEEEAWRSALATLIRGLGTDQPPCPVSNSNSILPG